MKLLLGEGSRLRTETWSVWLREVWLLWLGTAGLVFIRGRPPVSLCFVLTRACASFGSTDWIKRIRGQAVLKVKAFRNKGRVEFISWLLVGVFFLIIFPLILCMLATLAGLPGFTNINSSPYKEIKVHCRDEIWCFRSGERYKFPTFWRHPAGYKLLQTRTSQLLSVFRVKKDWKEIGVKILERKGMMF